MSDVMIVNVLNSGWIEVQLDAGRTIDAPADRLNSWLETAKRWGLRVTDTVRYADKDYALILNKA